MYDRNVALAEAIMDAIGAEALIDEILRALNTDTATEVLDYIAANWEIEIDE